MGTTTMKGEIGEAMVLADLRRRGYGVAIPFGHDLPFDLILVRPTGEMERVQCKYTESDGRVVQVRCQSSSDWVQYTYTPEVVDWIAVYDVTTDRCYYLHSGVFGGLARPSLRLTPPRNGQKKGIRWASDHLSPEVLSSVGSNRQPFRPPLPFRPSPE